MICQSCGQPKNELHPKSSQLIKTMTLILCNSCIESGLEPRYMIILAIRSLGASTKASKLISQRKYIGPDILASDIV